MLIYAFGHRKQTGKDTFCRFLECYLRLNKKGLNIRKVGFSDKLKDICHQLYGWAGLGPGEIYEQYPNMKEEIIPALGKSPRRIWIDLGSNAIRNHVYDSTWTDWLFNNIKCDILLIKDLRFMDEVQAVKKYGGVICRIDKSNIPHTNDEADKVLAEYTEWDFIINNAGTLKDFHLEAEKFGQQILNKL